MKTIRRTLRFFLYALKNISENIRENEHFPEKNPKKKSRKNERCSAAIQDLAITVVPDMDLESHGVCLRGRSVDRPGKCVSCIYLKSYLRTLVCSISLLGLQGDYGAVYRYVRDEKYFPKLEQGGGGSN